MSGKSKNNMDLLEELVELDARLAEESEVRMNEWELKFTESMTRIYNDAIKDEEEYGNCDPLLTLKQKQCVEEILKKYEG